MPSTERRRVLLHAFSTFAPGGPQVRFVELANAFGTEFKHLIVAMDGCFDASKRLDPGLDYELLPVTVQRGRMLANRGAFREMLEHRRPDQLFSYNWGAIEWLAGNTPRLLPQVHVEDGFSPEEVHTQLPRRVWTRRVLFMAARARLLVPSQRLKDIAASWWVPASRVRLVLNGVHVPENLAHRRMLPGRGGPVVIGTVAALRPEKNLKRLLRAVAELRSEFELRLLIAGDGPERMALEKLAEQLQIRDITEFTGYLADPTSALDRMDLFALSSDTEQLPMAMLEAMAQGLPVVASAVGDVPRLMPAIARSALSKPDDAEFTVVLASALRNQLAWGDWGAAGYRTVQDEYTRERMLAAWLHIFRGNWSTESGY